MAKNTEESFSEEILKLVNLGCGAHYHPDWVNLDMNPSSKAVGLLNLHEPLPFPDCSVDVVYTSHVIEHFAYADGLKILKEIFRTIKPGGIIRLVTPDLESIVKNYQETLKDALEGKALADDKYEWILLELFDQSVREKRGGGMADFLREGGVSIQSFVRDRIGHEVDGYWNKPAHHSLWKRIRSANSKMIFQYGRNVVAKALVHAVAGQNAAKAFEIGTFRQSGEIHYRSYDCYSLKKILTAAGFNQTKLCHASESQIQNFSHYELDIVNGEIRKPDSIYIEAVK